MVGPRRPCPGARSARGPRPGRDVGRRPGHGLQLLGRRPTSLRDRRRPARQRPAPRHRNALDLVPQRSPLPGRLRRVPVRRRGRLVPGPARRRPRPERSNRLGRDGCVPGRPGPGDRARRPDGPDALPVRGRAAAVRHPHRDDPRRGRARRGRDRSDHAPRSHPQRRGAAAGRRAGSVRTPLDRHPRRRPDGRGDLPRQHGSRPRRVPGRARVVRHARPELRLCRRRRAHRLPVAGIDPRSLGSRGPR